jgi:hypothetical protein
MELQLQMAAVTCWSCTRWLLVLLLLLLLLLLVLTLPSMLSNCRAPLPCWIETLPVD